MPWLLSAIAVNFLFIIAAAIAVEQPASLTFSIVKKTASFMIC